MKYVLSLILSFTLAGVAFAQVEPPKAPVKPLAAKVTPAAPKGGELAVISTEAENALLDFEGAFTAGQAKQVGKELYVAVPKCKEAKVYVVWNTYFFDGKIVKEKVEIKVAGDAPTPPKPGPPEPPKPDDVATALKKLTDAITGLDHRVGTLGTEQAMLTARVAVLEGARPPPGPVPVPEPTDEFYKSLKNGWLKETAADKSMRGDLAALYDQSIGYAKTDKTLVTAKMLFDKMHGARLTLIKEAMPHTRAAITVYLDANLPRAVGAPLDDATRDKAAFHFDVVSKYLARLP